VDTLSLGKQWTGQQDVKTCWPDQFSSYELEGASWERDERSLGSQGVVAVNFVLIPQSWMVDACTDLRVSDFDLL